MLDIQEITISVPWGHIAVKTWGSKENSPILLLHGIQDNAGSFDLLIPKLPENNYYVCVDFPSHGKSSHFPAHVYIHSSLFVLAVKYVIDYFKWNKITIIAHSLGARTACYLAMTYPTLIERLIFLDAIAIYPVHPGNFKKICSKYFNNFIKLEHKLKKNSPPIYTLEEALHRIMEHRPTAISKEGALNVLNRSLIPCEKGKFQFSMDQRLKCLFFDVLSNHNISAIIKYSRFRFPHLILLASETDQLKFDKLILSELKCNPNCKIITVNGNHDVHNNNPNLIARYINIFLNKYPTPQYSKL